MNHCLNRQNWSTIYQLSHHHQRHPKFLWNGSISLAYRLILAKISMITAIAAMIWNFRCPGFGVRSSLKRSVKGISNAISNKMVHSSEAIHMFVRRRFKEVRELACWPQDVIPDLTEVCLSHHIRLIRHQKIITQHSQTWKRPSSNVRISPKTYPQTVHPAHLAQLQAMMVANPRIITRLP